MTATTDPLTLHTSALNALTAAAQAKLAADRGIPRAVVVAQRHGLSGDDIRQAFERDGLDFAEVLPLVQAYDERGDVL